MKIVSKMVIMVSLILSFSYVLAIEGAVTQQSSKGSGQQSWGAWGKEKLINLYQRLPSEAAYIPGGLAGLYGSGVLAHAAMSHDDPSIRREAVAQFGPALREALNALPYDNDISPELLIYYMSRYGSKIGDALSAGNSALAPVAQKITGYLNEKYAPYIAELNRGTKYLAMAAPLIAVPYLYNYYQSMKKEAAFEAERVAEWAKFIDENANKNLHDIANNWVENFGKLEPLVQQAGDNEALKALRTNWRLFKKAATGKAEPIKESALKNESVLLAAIASKINEQYAKKIELFPW